MRTMESGTERSVRTCTFPIDRLVCLQFYSTILLSVISLLNEPNTQSPANVDASVMYRKWKDGHDDQYKERVR